jgi:hypothetical protein
MKRSGLKSLLNDRNRVWFFVPPPHPKAGLYGGERALRKVGLERVAQDVPLSKRTGLLRALRTWFELYSVLPHLGTGKEIYAPPGYDDGALRRIIFQTRRCEQRKSPAKSPASGEPLVVRTDGSKAKGGGYGGAAFRKDQVVGTFQGGILSDPPFATHELEMLALAQGAVLALALGSPVRIESDAQGVVEKLRRGRGGASSPLEEALQALLGILRSHNLLQDLRYVERGKNGRAHVLSQEGRKEAEEEDPLTLFLRAIPLAYRASALDYLLRLSSLKEETREAWLANPKSQTAFQVAQARREMPMAFERALAFLAQKTEEDLIKLREKLLLGSMGGLPPTEKQRRFLEARGVDASKLTRKEASEIIARIKATTQGEGISPNGKGRETKT